MPTPLDATTEKQHQDDAVLPEPTETQRLFPATRNRTRLRQRFGDSLKEHGPRRTAGIAIIG